MPIRCNIGTERQFSVGLSAATFSIIRLIPSTRQWEARTLKRSESNYSISRRSASRLRSDTALDAGTGQRWSHELQRSTRCNFETILRQITLIRASVLHCHYNFKASERPIRSTLQQAYLRSENRSILFLFSFTTFQSTELEATFFATRILNSAKNWNWTHPVFDADGHCRRGKGEKRCFASAKCSQWQRRNVLNGNRAWSKLSSQIFYIHVYCIKLLT